MQKRVHGSPPEPPRTTRRKADHAQGLIAEGREDGLLHLSQ